MEGEQTTQLGHVQYITLCQALQGTRGGAGCHKIDRGVVCVLGKLPEIHLRRDVNSAKVKHVNSVSGGPGRELHLLHILSTLDKLFSLNLDVIIGKMRLYDMVLVSVYSSDD